MSGLFTPEEAWAGGSYELRLELGERNDEKLLRALKTLWQHPTLTGCYLRMDVEPNEQSRLDPASADLPHFPALPLHGYLCGIASLPNGHEVASMTDVVREQDGTDWLWFGVPMGSLGTAYPVRGYPADDGQPHTWCAEIDDWLADIGRWVFQHVPFRLGLVGWCVDEPIRAADIERDGLSRAGQLGILWPAVDDLEWHPPARSFRQG